MIQMVCISGLLKHVRSEKTGTFVRSFIWALLFQSIDVIIQYMKVSQLVTGMQCRYPDLVYSPPAFHLTVTHNMIQPITKKTTIKISITGNSILKKIMGPGLRKSRGIRFIKIPCHVLSKLAVIQLNLKYTLLVIASYTYLCYNNDYCSLTFSASLEFFPSLETSW